MTIERPDDQPSADPATNPVDAASVEEQLLGVLEGLKRIQMGLDTSHALFMEQRRRYKALLAAHGIEDTTHIDGARP